MAEFFVNIFPLTYFLPFYAYQAHNLHSNYPWDSVNSVKITLIDVKDQN